MKVVKLIFLLLSSFILTKNLEASDLKNIGQAPMYSGIDQFSQKLNSANNLGKVSLVNFFFTSCQGPCPILMEKVKLVLDKANTCKDLNIISITVDPETDTPMVLKSYSEKRGFVAPNWKLVRMEKEKVVDLINSGFHLGQGESIATHTTRMAIVDKYGSLRALIGGMDDDAVNRISSTILELCK